MTIKQIYSKVKVWFENDDSELVHSDEIEEIGFNEFLKDNYNLKNFETREQAEAFVQEAVKQYLNKTKAIERKPQPFENFSTITDIATGEKSYGYSVGEITPRKSAELIYNIVRTRKGYNIRCLK